MRLLLQLVTYYHLLPDLPWLCAVHGNLQHCKAAGGAGLRMSMPVCTWYEVVPSSITGLKDLQAVLLRHKGDEMTR